MNKEDLLNNFIENLQDKDNLLPVGYYYLQKPSVKIVFTRNSESDYHGSQKFIVGEFYKPISLILI